MQSDKMMSRPIEHRYQDPLDAIWTSAALRMGLEVKRSSATYAHTDGCGTLFVATQEDMDPDDCLAQMIFHEICHSLVQGSQSFGWVDWGLNNTDNTHDEREHACIRLQAALLDPYGLRAFLGPTTDFRSYYDSLGSDPFAEHNESERESIVRGRAAWTRRNRRPWRGHLDQALSATAQVLKIAEAYLGSSAPSNSLLRTLGPSRPLHKIGVPLLPTDDLPVESPTCSDCSWSYLGGRGTSVLRCRQAEGARIDKALPACDRYEGQFDCLSCGACCREAYDTVEVARRDPALKLHLPLMKERSGGYDMKREGSRCICLNGGVALSPTEPAIPGGQLAPDEGLKVAPLAMPGGKDFTCSIYATRPRTCRQFTLFSENCLHARRTVGLSR